MPPAPPHTTILEDENAHWKRGTKIYTLPDGDNTRNEFEQQTAPQVRNFEPIDTKLNNPVAHLAVGELVEAFSWLAVKHDVCRIAVESREPRRPRTANPVKEPPTAAKGD